jgi:hypothetical protein
MTVSRNANGLVRPAAIVVPVWTHIAQLQQHHAGRIELAEAENGRERTGTRDRGLGPGPFRGRGREMGDSQGRGQDRGLASGRERVLTRGPAPVPVPLLAQGHGRATGEPVTENAPIILAPEAGLGVAAGVAARNPNAEEREVVRRMCVFCLSITSSLYLTHVSEEREERTAEEWGGISCCGQRVG